MARQWVTGRGRPLPPPVIGCLDPTLTGHLACIGEGPDDAWKRAQLHRRLRGQGVVACYRARPDPIARVASGSDL